MQIPSNCEIDPTTAIAIGAAYYAATKEKQLVDFNTPKKQSTISIRPVYQKVSTEKEELFAARITGEVTGLFYRITREDGGFNTGLKKLSERISEDLPLVERSFNFFKFTVYDELNNVIDTDMETIGINSAIGGEIKQPIHDDICLEIDDYENLGETRLQLIFQKNSNLPAKRTITYSLNKTIIKGSDNEIIRINVLEGSNLALPEANKSIGYMQFTGKNLKRDIVKGSDVEITFSMSESRDLTIAVYFNMAGQEFIETFNPKVRHTRVDLLQIEVTDLAEKLEEEIEQATQNEDYGTADALSKLRTEMNKLTDETKNLTIDDSTDNRYKSEDRKRKIAQEIFNATPNKHLQEIKSRYSEVKSECDEMIHENRNDYERKAYNDIVALENTFLVSNSSIKIQEKIDELRAITGQIRWRTPEFLLGVFKWLQNEQPKMNNQVQAKSLLDAGRFASESQNWDRLKEINFGLLDLLPGEGNKENISTKMGLQ